MNVALCRFDSFSDSDKELLGNQGEMRKLEGQFDRATEFVIGECKWGIAKRLFFIKQTLFCALAGDYHEQTQAWMARRSR